MPQEESVDGKEDPAAVKEKEKGNAYVACVMGGMIVGGICGKLFLEHGVGGFFAIGSGSSRGGSIGGVIGVGVGALVGYYMYKLIFAGEEPVDRENRSTVKSADGETGKSSTGNWRIERAVMCIFVLLGALAGGLIDSIIDGNRTLIMVGGVLGGIGGIFVYRWWCEEES
jgi:hypothetical protein